MPVETLTYPHPEIASFTKTWRRKLPEQFIEELASYSLETKGIPDPYYYEVRRNGELFSPSAHCRIKETVEDKTGPLGRLEYQAVLSIEEWAANNQEGSIVWVSPPYPGVYFESKITIYEIQHKNGEKRLFNRSIVFKNFNRKDCLEFAQDLAKFSQNRPEFSQPDSVRATPLVLKTYGDSWIYILQELIDDPILWNNIKKGEDQRAKEEAIKQATIVQKGFHSVSGPSYQANPVQSEIDILKMLGPNRGSCPVLFSSGGKTAFQVLSENSLTFTSSATKDPDYCIRCGACGEKINCVVRRGEKCPKCPAIRSC